MRLFNKIFNKLNFALGKKSGMEAEIYEQPEIISKIINKYILKDGNININIPDNVNKIAIIASGSSYHSATIIANYLRNNVKCDAQSYYASEFSLIHNPKIDSETLYIFVSQSGETSDTNKALDMVRKYTNKTLAITNTQNSTLYNNAKYKLLTYAGKETAIASTKSMSAQLFCMFLISAKIMQQREMPVDTLIYELKNAATYIFNAFKYREIIKIYSNKLINYDNASILASGMFYPLAKEGALKSKETSYINTTAYPTGEFLHGHIAILNKRCAVIIVINNDNIEFTKNVIKNIEENYKSDLLIISAVPYSQRDNNIVISANTGFEIDFVFTTLVVFQLLALEAAIKLSRDVDHPEGLTKVVK